MSDNHFDHQMQSRVKRQRGGEEMLGQSRAEERRDNFNISELDYIQIMNFKGK